MLEPDLPTSLTSKIITERDSAGELPRPLVFTNGVFDVLHPGHVIYLAAARTVGTTLLVGVNSDASARTLGKGPGRPLNRDRDRLLMLASLQSVSYVVLFDEHTPCDLIRQIKPDIYVKGGDYDMEVLEETRLVRSWGGRSIAIPLCAGYSTTALVRQILQTA